MLCVPGFKQQSCFAASKHVLSPGAFGMVLSGELNADDFVCSDMPARTPRVCWALTPADAAAPKRP